MSRNQIFLSAVAMAIALFSLSPKSTAGDSGAREPAGEWRLRGGNAEAQFFSPLNQINEANVKRLGLAWAVDLPRRMGLSVRRW
jgi:quinohemoprotein ethanol dehydrogenase